jgi:hypothetical protein
MRGLCRLPPQEFEATAATFSTPELYIVLDAFGNRKCHRLIPSVIKLITEKRVVKVWRITVNHDQIPHVLPDMISWDEDFRGEKRRKTGEEEEGRDFRRWLENWSDPSYKAVTWDFGIGMYDDEDEAKDALLRLVVDKLEVNEGERLSEGQRDEFRRAIHLFEQRLPHPVRSRRQLAIEYHSDGELFAVATEDDYDWGFYEFSIDKFVKLLTILIRGDTEEEEEAHEHPPREDDEEEELF